MGTARSIRNRTWRVAVGLLLGAAAAAQGQTLRLDPPEIRLAGPDASQQFLATYTGPDGVSEDVTSSARIQVLDAAVLQVDAVRMRFTGLAPGEARVEARVRGLTAKTVVHVGRGGGDMAVRFSPDVITILTIKGCNSSNCHGAIAGKSGFKLSLFGYDVKADHDMMVKAHDGRRVDLQKPEDSLLLKKPAFEIPHGGGKVLPVGSHDYETLLKWLRQGARLDASGPTVTRLQMYPPERTLIAGSGDQRVLVISRLSDGTTRDMTTEVRYETSNDAIVKLGSPGSFAAGAPGLATIMARAMGKAATSQIGLITAPSGPDFRHPKPRNFIDGLVFAKLRRMNIPVAGRSSDEEFLRRVYADAIGRVPKPEERKRFLADTTPDRRARLIDELLDHPEYASYRTLRLEDWFRNTQLFSQGRPMGVFRYWLKDQVEADRPYDELVRDLLTSSGDTARNPASGFWLPVTDFMLNKFDVKAATPMVTRLFLGVRMECAECHNHPLENFTQDDFYGLAAFFGQMRIKIGQGVYRRTWYLDETAEVEHPSTKQPVLPKVLAGEPLTVPKDDDRRSRLADWMTSPGNPYFARATVNRVWHSYWGTGIVEPFDDFRSTNAPTNPELLDGLADYFIAKKFSMKELDRVIFNSATYQLSSKLPRTAGSSEELERLLFARYRPRRLPAEVLLDSISQVTGVAQTFGSHPPGTLAKDVEVNDAPSYFLATFGFPRRDLLGQRHEAPTLSQALHLMNRETLKEKLEPDSNLIGQLIAKGVSDEAIIGEFFERAYSRLPRDEETGLIVSHMNEEVRSGRSRRRTLENVLLVILNSKEFQLNH